MIFDKLKNGESVDMMSADYLPAIEEINRSAKLCWKLNATEPDPEKIRPLLAELFSDGLDASSYLMTPFQIDFGRNVKIGRNVFVNHSLCMMSAGGIEIGDGTQIGPQVTMVTTNHDFNHRNILKCKTIKIGKNVWIGARVTIMPGVTIGDNAIIAGGALVVKDVEADTVVAGVSAKYLKHI